MKDALPTRVRLGVFEVDLQVGELREGERTILLQEQPFRILRMLIEHGGELLTREEIKKKFWPNDTVVEFDHSINAAIGKLRRALDDSANEPKYIETIPRRGYRLMLPVELIVLAEDAPAEALPQIADSFATELPKPPSGALSGRTVSHYRVLDIIGGGGMGVVYRAEDLKLGRRVALKFLPEELGSDPHALERFSREARSISSLDHPNICSIHEFGEHEDRPFMVMQLLQGQTVRDRLTAAQGPLPIEELLDIGMQVSGGLRAAHEAGIIHRDIKPANIFITDKGVCKILDFGVAKLLELGNEDELPPQPAIPAVASPAAAAGLALTSTGIALGTAGYMSPEQVRGGKLDARTDIFSFGLVLYEMATGQRAFAGETAEIVRDRVLHQPHIPVHDLNSNVPPKLEIIINKTLQKERQNRYPTAAGMGSDLEQLQRTAESAVPQPRPRRHGRTVVWATVAIALLALASGLSWFKGQRIVSGKVPNERRVTYNPSENRLIGAAISPDGKYVAYTDTKGLHLSVIETGEQHDVPLPDELRTHLWAVTWFPDGERLLFTASSEEGHTIWMTSVFGAAPQKLQGDSDLWAVASPQGSSIAFVSANAHEIRVMGANGENPHRIMAAENETFQGLAWSPTGHRLAYIKVAGGQAGGTIETVPLDGGAPSVVISRPQLVIAGGPNLLWSRDGRIIFQVDEVPGENGSNLWEIATDPQTGNPSGQATKLTNSVGLNTYSASVSWDAKRLAVVKTHSRNDVYIGELNDAGTRLTSPARLTLSESDDYITGWMTDSKAILFQSNRTGRNQVFRQRMERDTAVPLFRSTEEQDSAQLSPDGHWILYWSTEPAKDSPPTTKRLMRFPVSGGSPEQILEVSMQDSASFDCPTRPGSSCVFNRWERGELVFCALDPLKGFGRKLASTQLGRPSDLSMSISPEGSRVALASLDQLRSQVRIMDLTSGTERNLQLPHGWYIWSLSWTAGGDALFAAAQSTAGYVIVRIELDGTMVALLDRGRNNWLGNVCSSPDGRHLAFTQMTWENNVWLLENF